MLGRLFVEYALSDEQAQEWLHFFASSDFIFASDESWANTIARHSPFNHTTVFDRRLGSTMALWFGPNCRSHRNPREKSSPCYLGMKYALPSLPLCRRTQAHTHLTRRFVSP
jgi:hypothetical protein